MQEQNEHVCRAERQQPFKHADQEQKANKQQPQSEGDWRWRGHIVGIATGAAKSDSLPEGPSQAGHNEFSQPNYTSL